MSPARNAAVLALGLAVLLPASAGCNRQGASSTSPSSAPVASTAAVGPTLALRGETAPTADTFEGLELKGRLSLEVRGDAVCALVTDGETRRALMLPGDWRYATGPDRVVDADGNDVMKAGDDLGAMVFSPAYVQHLPAPCGGASEVVAVDGVSPKD